MHRRSEMFRLPLGPRAKPSSARVAGVVALALVACAVAAAMGPWGVAWRASSVVALVTLAGVLQHVLARRQSPPHGWLVADDEGVWRADGGREVPVIDWSEPFGATVLATADRATLLLALSSAGATRYISAHVTDAEDAAAAPTLFERATTAAESDLRVSHDAALCAADAEKLVSEIVRRSPAALDRAYLSDAKGEPVVLDRGELRVGPRCIDLSAPLEWRAFVFQELGAHVASVFQGTWVRQAEAEVVLVAPMPADGTWLRSADAALRAAGEGGAVQRAVARDIRLMNATVGEPPPRELRRAIDHLFMLPLRRALDRAPRAARLPSRSEPSLRP